MLDKLDLIPHEKIIVSFGYYVVNQDNQDSYFVYSNTKGNLILFYQDESREFLYIEFFKLQKLNKKELFFFLSNSLEKEFVDNKILEANTIDSYTKANFSKTFSFKDIVNGFLHVTPSDLFIKNPILNAICYNRAGINCMFLFPSGNKNSIPSDIISFGDDLEQVESYFGANGCHIEIKEKKPLLISYNPRFLELYDLAEHSFLITPYHYSTFDLMRTIKKSEPSKIIIPVQGKNSLRYKTKMLLKLYGFISSIDFNLELYLNHHYIEIEFSFPANPQTKLDLINLFSGIKQTVFKNLDYIENLEKIESFYDFSISTLNIFNNKTIGKITIRNSIDILLVLNTKLAQVCNQKFNLNIE